MTETFSDGFDGPLDRSIWSPGIGMAGTANASELQWYLPDEVSTEDGNLVLTAHKRDYRGKSITSGAVNSAEGFAQRYGRFEARIRLPEGAGTWPAFWLLPIDNSWPPEIDIMEQLGRSPRSYFASNHNLVSGKKVGETREAPLPASDDGFHLFALDWRPDGMVFSVDGKEAATITENIPDKPMFMLLNLAFGGSWAGPVSWWTRFPSAMAVDYVKVYQYCDLLGQGAPRFLQLGKPATSGSDLRSGGSLAVSGTVTAGREAVPGVSVSATLLTYDGRKIVAHGKAAVGDLAAGASGAYAIRIPIPEGTPADYYNLKVETISPKAFLDPVTAKPKNNAYRGSADILKIVE